MAHGAKKFVGRAHQRYKFDDEDRRFIRLKAPNMSRALTTRIFDLSESGISFMVASRLAPRVGEIISLEFAPMGSVQMACKGRVVRIEEPSKNAKWNKFPDTVKVGVAFHDLPKPYQRVLLESLSTAFRRQEVFAPKDRVLEVVSGGNAYSDADNWLADNILSLTIGFAIIILVAIGVYVLSQTLKTEQPTTQAPWASGFFEKVVKPSK